jgi:hypothetical protein
MGQHNIVEEFITTQERFLALQSAVAEELKKKCEAVKPSFINIWNAITKFLVIILLFPLIPLAWQVVIKMFGKDLLLNYKYLIFGLIMILFICGRPSFILFGYLIKKHPRMKPLIRFLDSIISPLEIGLIYEGLDYLLKNKFSNHIYGSFFIILFLSLLIAFLIASIRSAVPNFLILLVSNRIVIDPHEKPLSYESITEKVIKTVYISTQSWSTSAVQKVRMYSQKRSAYLSTQVQTFSPAFGALALLGLLALFFTQEQVKGMVKNFDDMLEHLSGAPGSGLSELLIIAGVILFALGGCSYFVNSYWSICVLEIIDTLCLIRIDECEREKKDVEERLSSHQPLLYSQTYTGMLLNYFRQFSFKSSHHKGKY